MQALLHYRIHLAKYALWWRPWFHNKKSGKHLGTKIIQRRWVSFLLILVTALNSAIHYSLGLTWATVLQAWRITSTEYWADPFASAVQRTTNQHWYVPGALEHLYSFPSYKSTYTPSLERFTEHWHHRPEKGTVPWIKTWAQRSKVQPKLISGDKEKATSFRCQG